MAGTFADRNGPGNRAQESEADDGRGARRHEPQQTWVLSVGGCAPIAPGLTHLAAPVFKYSSNEIFLAQQSRLLEKRVAPIPPPARWIGWGQKVRKDEC